MSHHGQRDYFCIGGTMSPESPSYVKRDADEELAGHILRGDYCFVLTSRQTGKSSLVAAVSKTLRAQGLRPASVDLSLLGTEDGDGSADHWYFAFAHELLQQLRLEFKLKDWWDGHASQTPLHRLNEFLSDVVLAEIPDAFIVVFVDEIDTTIGLSFADDFFAAIRACYNARASDEAFRRLTFVLLGVASPSELIADPRRTPFNIGHRIELSDFTAKQAEQLATGLASDVKTGMLFLDRILYWTSGHPYLTQRICREVATHAFTVFENVRVDDIVAKLFLVGDQGRGDENLEFVANRIRDGGGDRHEMMRVYRKLLRPHRAEISVSPISPSHSALRLSGIVRVDGEGFLRIRNRIYENVFNAKWARRVAPINWSRRAATLVLAVVPVIMVAWYLIIVPGQFADSLEKSLDDTTIARSSYESLRRIPFQKVYADRLWREYVNRRAAAAIKRDSLEMAQAVSQELAELDQPLDQPPLAKNHMAEFYDARAKRVELMGNRDWGIVLRLLALTYVDDSDRRHELSDLIGQDYRMLKGVVGGRQQKFLCVSPDGNHLLIAGRDKTLRLVDVRTLSTIKGPLHTSGIIRLATFSPDGKSAVVGFGNSSVRVLDIDKFDWRTRELQLDADRIVAIEVAAHKQIFVVRCYRSPSNSKTTVATESPPVFFQLRSLNDGKRLGEFAFGSSSFYELIEFSPDGQRLLLGSGDFANVINAMTGEKCCDPIRHVGGIYCGGFSQDGTLFVTAGKSDRAKISAADGSGLVKEISHLGGINDARFSPDSGTLLTWSRKNSNVRLWNSHTWHEICFIDEISPGVETHGDSITGEKRYKYVAVYTPGGGKILTGHIDGKVRFWNTADGTEEMPRLHHETPVDSIRIDRQGELIVTTNRNGSVHVWRFDDRSRISPVFRHSVEAAVNGPAVKRTELLAGGSVLLTLDAHKIVRLWALDSDAIEDPIGPNPDEAFRLWRDRLQIQLQDYELIIQNRTE